MEITFRVNRKTGKTSMEIKGVKGKKCAPIHDLVTKEMTALGADVSASRDTPEMNEVETVQTSRLQVRS